ncbi:MAG TPA: VOC family protein [Oceanospirillales bacterium]|nr:VOC family protein [Oceanospirillales bacterium]
MIKVKGIGGVFFKCVDGESLKHWYKKHLGFDTDEYGAIFTAKTMPENAQTVWSPFKADTKYFEPSDQQFMLNLIVEDVPQALKQVQAGGAQLVGDVLDEDYGVFGWFIDPQGFKVELWSPK